MNRLIQLFLEYVKIDTQSDPDSSSFPSTKKQKDLSALLLKQLKDLNLEAHLDSYGYVYAFLPKNDPSYKNIGFIAHVDTSPDAPGANVNPRIIKNYDGSTIQLNDKLSMHPLQFPSLVRVIHDDIIVTDGNTLLGADDKCGVAEIMEMLYRLDENKEIKHGDIFVCFTPDEEIGKGANHFDYDYFKSDFAYTLDGSEVGYIEFENFNAASAHVSFIGQSIHPGSAKLKMVNAIHLAFEFHQMLPTFLNPAFTEGYEGFNHLGHIKGEVETATTLYIIRNHDEMIFEKQKQDFINIATYMNHKYGYEAVLLDIKDSYYNMKRIIDSNMHIVHLAEQAMKNCGLEPKRAAIRGGTDGARLTFEGLPCPNLGTGGYHFHGRLEFASIQQMEKAVEVMLEIINLRK